jgi:hypothetical protein
MCITHINIHICWRTYVGNNTCLPTLKALEITTYMERPDGEKKANPMELDENSLLTLLAECRWKCIQESGVYGRRRSYK